MSGTGNENEEPNHRRSTRARKLREANPCEFLDEEEDGVSTAASGSPSSNGGSSSNASNNPSSETRVAMPYVHGQSHWHQKKDFGEFYSVDGRSKITHTYRRWGGEGNTYLSWHCSTAIEKAETALVAKQNERFVSLDIENFGCESKLTQAPYHADMLPFYEYFADGIQQHTGLESFSISNFHLPPAHWLGESILPKLETTFISELVLSRCSLSGEDLASIATFLQGNTTLCSVDISGSNIAEEETVKLLTKAIRKHPALTEVNLSECSLAGDNGVLEKLLLACKAAKIEGLGIGHKDMSSEAVASIAKFLGRKNSFTAFALVGAPVDKDNKKALEQSLVKNKTIESLCISSNGLALPGVLRNTKKAMKSLSRLTSLDLSFNSLPVQGAKALAKILEHADCSLETLILSNNHLTTKGANHILPALKENETVATLDLSGNWLNDAVAPAVVDLLQKNSTLLSLDLSGNGSLKTSYGGRRRWWRGETTPKRDGGGAHIVKNSLFDTTSLEAIANSNHTCSVLFSGRNREYHETIANINELDVAEGVKIRYKVVLALTEVNTDLYDPRSFKDVPLELMPKLLHLVQQELGCSGFGRELLPNSKLRKDRSKKGRWNRTTYRRDIIADPTLSCIYEVIMGWQSLPLLFVNGAGALPKKKVTKQAAKKKSLKRRRKFGEEEDDDDEPYIPKGARKTAKYVYNRETHRYDCILPAPVY